MKSPLYSLIVAIGMIVGLGQLGTAAARGDYFVWQDTCTSDSWHACCDILGDNYNNWFLTPAPGCPPYPGTADDVDLVAYSVYLDTLAYVYSLDSAGVFRLVDMGVCVHTTGTLDGTFLWDAGTLCGLETGSAWNINYLAELRSGGAKGISAVVLNINPGALAAVTGTGDLIMGYSELRIRTGTIDGVFDEQTDFSILPNPSGGTGTVFNDGLFKKTGGTGTSLVDLSFSNAGQVQVKTGTLRLSGGGTSSGSFDIDAGAVLECTEQTWTAGATVTGLGLVRVPQGALTLDTGAVVTTPNVELLAPGLVKGAGSLSISDSLNWLGGGFENASTSLASSAAVTLGGGDAKLLHFGVLNNATSMTWTDSGNLSMAYSTLNNLPAGAIDVQTDADVTSGGGAVIDNDGTLTKSASVGETRIDPVFNNAGTVDVQSGRLSFYDFTQTAGLTKLNGGDLGAPGSTLKVLGGVLAGTGSIYGHVLNDGGEIRPGFSPGTIVITGDYGPSMYTQSAAGALAMEVGGHTPGSAYDQLLASGWAFLDGTINVSLIGGFVPEPGDSFVLVTYMGHSGQFATVNLPAAVSTRRFGLFVEPTSAVLRVGLRGDLSCDGTVDFGDINPFVLLLSNPTAWQAAYPECPVLNGDINGDGSAGFSDINPFVALLSR